MSPEPFDSRAKAPTAKRWEKGYGDENGVGFAKVLALTLSENLTWNCHVEKIITKGNKWMFFIIQLKRASIPVDDIVTFYCTCFRPVFHHGLPKYLSDDIEGVQKRALKIISP